MGWPKVANCRKTGFEVTPRIFLSYRWSDSAGWTRTIYERLVGRYGTDAVFFDNASMAPADHIDRTMATALTSAELVVPVVGPRWLDVLLERTERPDPDRVFWEVATAIEHDQPLLPVLVDGATMPPASRLPEALRPMEAHKATRLANESLDRDMAALLAAVGHVVRPGPAPRRARAAPTGGPAAAPRPAAPVAPAPTGPAIDPDPPCRVGPSAEATHQDLAAAVAAAAGAVVLVEPGEYETRLDLGGVVELQAVDAGTVTLTGPAPVLTVSGEVCLRGIAVAARDGEPTAPAVAVTRGRLELEQASVRAGGGPGVRVAGTAALVLREVVISGASVGVDVADGATAQLHGVEVDRPAEVGLLAADSARVSAERGSVVLGRVGIEVRDDAEVRLDGVVVESPRESALLAGGRSRLTAQACVLRGGQRTVVARDESQVQALGIDVAESGDGAVVVADDARLLLDGARLHALGSAAALAVGPPPADAGPVGRRRREPADPAPTSSAEAFVRRTAVTSSAAPAAVAVGAGGRLLLVDLALADVERGVLVGAGATALLLPGERDGTTVASRAEQVQVLAGGGLDVVGRPGGGNLTAAGPGRVELREDLPELSAWQREHLGGV